jgi:hypothetical protein
VATIALMLLSAQTSLSIAQHAGRINEGPPIIEGPAVIFLQPFTIRLPESDSQAPPAAQPQTSPSPTDSSANEEFVKNVGAALAAARVAAALANDAQAAAAAEAALAAAAAEGAGAAAAATAPEPVVSKGFAAVLGAMALGTFLGVFVASLWGDPHFTTADGLHYSFQGAGDFFLARHQLKSWDVQIRQAPVANSTSVALAMGLGLRYGRDVFSIRADENKDSPTVIQTICNGKPVVLDTIGQVVVLQGGTRVARTTRSDVIVQSGDRSLEVRVAMLPIGMTVSLAMETSAKPGARGLIGVPDGDPSNDWSTPDGRALHVGPDADQGAWLRLHREFGESWRVPPRERIIHGLAVDDPGFPASRPEPDEKERAIAERVCRQAGVSTPHYLQDCIMDVSSTGDKAFAAEASYHQGTEADTKILAHVESVNPVVRATPRPVSDLANALPCQLERYEWSTQGGGCPYGHVSIDRGDGVWLYNEHGCDSVHGKVTVRDGDVLAETTGSGWDINYTLHTSEGACDRIRANSVCMPGSRCEGQRATLEFVRGAERASTTKR